MTSPAFHRSAISQFFSSPLSILFIHFFIYLLSSSMAHSSPLIATYPCNSTEPIKWVRDPDDCQKYFICYFGQPITMPRCPATQVWSDGAVNCVPESSLWNDCTRHRSRSTSTRSTPIGTSSDPTDNKHPTTKVTILNLDRTSTTHHRPTATSSPKSVTKRGHQSITNPSWPNRYSSTNPEIPKLSTTPTTNNRYPGHEHPCSDHEGAIDGAILPHPSQCHWYYNCSLEATADGRQRQDWRKKYQEPFTMECPYPQLFDEHQLRCREYLNNYCGSRYEPVDRCEYRQEQCNDAHCIPCEQRFANCRGKPNGIYPFRTNVWSPIFVSCYGQRNIAQDKCMEPTPIFSPMEYNCVSLFNVPKENGGLKPDCSIRTDGLYADEQGRCSIYFECRSHIFLGYFECNRSLVFDPITRSCTSPDVAPPPCGVNRKPPSCQNREDGFYADEYGRCPYYFECKNSIFQSYHQCDFGSFDASQGQCIIPVDLMVKPCGLRPNPCNSNRYTGTYTMGIDLDQCHGYMECSHGLLIHNGTCSNGKMFNKDTGRCDHPENVLLPCGRKNLCANKTDGKYPAAPENPGCSSYYECRKGKFEGYKTCTHQIGGVVFNSAIGRCDVRRNVCPPCGYKWFGCGRKPETWRNYRVQTLL